MTKRKKLTQRFLRKKCENAREFRSLHFVPLTLVLLLDITQVTFVFTLKTVAVFVLPKGPKSFIKVTGSCLVQAAILLPAVVPRDIPKIRINTHCSIPTRTSTYPAYPLLHWQQKVTIK